MGKSLPELRGLGIDKETRGETVGWTIVYALRQWLGLGWRLVVELCHIEPRRRLSRALLFIGIWGFAGVLLCWHGIGFLLDELLFRGYRKIKVEQPLFVVGVPRSGTTWLQRVLANDRRLTSLTMWEALLAPSVSQRLLALTLARLLSAAKPLVVKLAQWSPLRSFDAVHQLRLREPEEDFLVLLPLQACMLGVFLCPHSEHYWRLGRFDEALDPDTRRRVMHFYYRCLQKHLYVRGSDKRILSKNPSFTSALASLKEQFPDALVVACVRDPEQAVPSQLSAVAPAIALLSGAEGARLINSRLLDLLHSYYRIVWAQSLYSKVPVLDMRELQHALAATVERLFEQLELEMSAEFHTALAQLAQQGSRYRSTHQYDLARFELSPAAVAARFQDHWPMSTILAEE